MAQHQQIQDAVREFLNGRSAYGIWQLACYNTNTRLPLVESAGVVAKLVELLVHNQPEGEGENALYALSFLVEIGPVAQDAIAHAHNGAIFTWLAGPEDHGIAHYKNPLITKLTHNHPTNTRILDAARGGGASLVKVLIDTRSDVAALVKLAHASISSGDTATAALAIDELSFILQEKNTTSTLPCDSISALVSIMNSNFNSTDGTLSTIQDQAMFLLVQHLHVEESRVALTQSRFGLVDHVNVLKNDTSDARNKLLAVIRLTALLETNALNIVLGGGVPALVNAVARTQSGILAKSLQEQASLALLGLIEASPEVRSHILERGIIDCLIQLSRSEDSSIKTIALDTLRVFLRDEKAAVGIARQYGLPFLLPLLHYDKQHATKQQTPVLEILSSVLASDDDVSAFRYMVNSERVITYLFSLLDDMSPATVAYLTKLAAKLGGLIPFLGARLENDVDNKGALLATLRALEPLSRSAVNQHFFKQQEGLKQLAKLLKASTNGEVKTTVARILANISYQNRYMSELIVESDVVQELFAMMNSTDVKPQTAGLMALRNLTNNDANRVRIGSPGLILLLIQTITSGKTMKQRVAAVAVLGNLAHLPANQKTIHSSGGVAAVLAFIPETTTPQQLETAAAALWVLTDATNGIGETGGVAIATSIQKAMRLHQPLQVPWATRLLQRLKPVRKPQ